MDSIRILNDGGRFYIVMENPSPEDKNAALDFVASMLGAKVSEETPTGVEPAKVEKYTVPDNLKEIPVVITHEEKPEMPEIKTIEDFVKWYPQINAFDADTKTKLIEEMRPIVRAYFRTCHKAKMDEVKKFLTDLEPVLTDMIANAVEKSESKDLEGFLNGSSDMQIQALYTSCRVSLSNELKIK